MYIEEDPGLWPEIPTRITLTSDMQTNEYLGLRKDVEWYEWSLFVRREEKLLTEKKYSDGMELVRSILERINSAFEDYKNSLILEEEK